MASRNLSDLKEEVRIKAEEVIRRCSEKGVDLLIYCTLRTLEEQSRLYRQSRKFSVITKKIDSLNRQGLNKIANILESVGPCSGPYVTDAGPGESWHNYGEAFDAVPLIDGKAAWDVKQFRNIWNIYGESVEKSGLVWSGRWKSFREMPHAQLRHKGNPLKMYVDDDEITNILIEYLHI